MKTSPLQRAARFFLNAAAWYLLVASGAVLLASAWLLVRAGGVLDVTPTELLLLPLDIARNPLNPAAAFAPWTAVLELPLRVSALAGIALFTWITLLRHGYANPVNAMRSEYELPLSRQLKPKLRDLGLWVAHDAARGDPKASPRDKILVKLVKSFRPHADLARAVTRRSNGILVPYQGPQPAARILLGNYRHLHLVRKKKYNVYARPEQHVVIFGPSGAGKGATQMVPSLLFWNGESDNSPDGHGKGWPGAIITSTVKSDHVDAALEWRESISSECYIYDPLQSYPEYRDYWVGWDPLVTISNFSDANAVAAALMESESQQAGGGGGNEEYFKAQALMVLSPMLLSAALKKLPFRSVYDWALKLENEAADPAVISPEGDVSPDSRTYAVMDPLYDYAEEVGDDTPLNQMQQIFAKDPREASGVWGTIRKILQPYNDEKSVMSTDQTAMPRMLNPKTFYSTPHATLFIIAPEVANEAKRMRPVFAAFITWLIEEAQKLAREHNGKLPRPVLANLDEVKNVGAIPGLAHTLSLTRSIGFFVKHAWQDEAQIASAYGKDDAKTITSNSRTWVILPGISDPEHLEALARLIGERPVKKRKTKVDPNNPDDNSRLKAATASMVKELKDNELLILTDNLPPFVINASRYFQDKVMLARHKLGDARRSGEAPPRPRQEELESSVDPGQKTSTLPALAGPVLATSVQARAEGALVPPQPAPMHEATPPVSPSSATQAPDGTGKPEQAGTGSSAEAPRYGGRGGGSTLQPKTPEPPHSPNEQNPWNLASREETTPQLNPHELADDTTPEAASKPTPPWATASPEPHPGLHAKPATAEEQEAPRYTQAATRQESKTLPSEQGRSAETGAPTFAHWSGSAPLSASDLALPPLPEQPPTAEPAWRPHRAERDNQSRGSSEDTATAPLETLFGARLGAVETAPQSQENHQDRTPEGGSADSPDRSAETTYATPPQAPILNHEQSSEQTVTLGALFQETPQERDQGGTGTREPRGETEQDATESPRNTCDQCGTQFSFDGLDSQQKSAIWQRHKAALHSQQGKRAQEEPVGTAYKDHRGPAAGGEQLEERTETPSNGWRTPEP